MYFFGPESRRDVDDFRDAVHDSCGLRIVNGAGERIWRPLRNPDALEVSAFADADMRGFGLIQRFRDFEHYQDSEAHYERRPSAWVEPAKPWGAGSVVLVEIPTRDEFLDNIVAFWRPEAPLEGGREYTFDYRLVWGVTPVDELPLARVAATRSGASILAPQERVFVIDFDLGRIDPGSVTPVVVSSAGEISGVSVQTLGMGDMARVGFHLDPGDAPAAELRVTLTAGDQTVSEVWLYRWSAPA
jgi:glucans biosynthesis protein